MYKHCMWCNTWCYKQEKVKPDIIGGAVLSFSLYLVYTEFILVFQLIETLSNPFPEPTSTEQSV